MGDTPTAIIQERIEWAQDRVIEAAVHELSENFDSFPVIGAGLAFVKKSAEKVLLRKVENELVPDLEEHTAVQLDYIQTIVEKENEEEVHEAYREALLETNPIWKSLDAPDDVEDEVEQKILEHSRESAETFAGWVGDAEGEFDGIAGLAEHLGIEGDEVAAHVHDMLYYIDLMQDYREHFDPSIYTSLLSNERVREWFLDNFIQGLEKGRTAVMEEIKTDVEEPP